MGNCEEVVSDGRRLLWCFDVFDRIRDLRIQSFFVRRTFGDRATIVASCNCHVKMLDEVKSIREIDHILWSDNRGHHEGTIDNYNKIAGFITDEVHEECVVVNQHAKSWLSDYSMVLDALDVLGDHDACFLSCDERCRVWLDFFMMTSSFYCRVFPLAESSGWSEDRVYSALNGKGRIVCAPHDTTPSDAHPSFYRRFVNVFGKYQMLCMYDVIAKLRALERLNPSLAYSLIDGDALL